MNDHLGVDFELDPGPMANNDHSNRDDVESCDTGTMMCNDLVSSYLVLSEHMISAFQKVYQACPLVKLYDSVSNVLGHACHSLFPMIQEWMLYLNAGLL
jgi:hypothetical protein